VADRDFITFGPVHLEVRDAERTARFWQELAGFERRASDGGSIEVGTKDETLLVLTGGARSPYKQDIAACTTLLFILRTRGPLQAR
jgi:catechol-2,3-dioxygenase